jgi:hypothetical protein
MAESKAKSSFRQGAAASLRSQGSDRVAMLRAMAARGYQLRASARAADRFLAQGNDEDTNTCGWLMSCAESQAAELVNDFADLAQQAKDGALEAPLVKPVQRLRVVAHRLHAATRAADRYLEAETPEDRETGGWLITTALGLADQLANELDDLASSLKRPANDAVIDAEPAAPTRRATFATHNA